MATRIGSAGSLVSMCFFFGLSALINETEVAALYGQTAQPTDLAFLTNGLVAYYPLHGNSKQRQSISHLLAE